MEEKHKGIIAILDDECLRPGDVSDDTFLDKLSKSVGTHPHFVCHETTDYEGRKELARDVSGEGIYGECSAWMFLVICTCS